VPEDEALRALFDRFLIRCHVASLGRDEMPRLLAAGWALEQAAPSATSLTAADLRALGQEVYRVDLTPITELYLDVIQRIRDLGVNFSDRRCIKVLKLLAASALLCGRDRATPSDLWVLRYVWDREEQIGPLGGMIDGVLAQQPAESAAHPRAARERVDAEELAAQLDAADKEITQGNGSLTVLARLRERVAGLSDRAAWVGDDALRKHLLERAAALLHRLG
jgi:MoxR-like ATPase